MSISLYAKVADLTKAVIDMTDETWYRGMMKETKVAQPTVLLNENRQVINTPDNLKNVLKNKKGNAYYAKVEIVPER